LAASLEHEEVLSHSLLYFFSTAMLVQKIATKGANSVYPSHMKTLSVLMYTELKIVQYWSILYVYTIWIVHITTVWKFYFAKKWYVSFYVSAHKTHVGELNFSKKYFSRRPVLCVHETSTFSHRVFLPLIQDLIQSSGRISLYTKSMALIYFKFISDAQFIANFSSIKIYQSDGNEFVEATNRFSELLHCIV
jgi:hypothetical protein